MAYSINRIIRFHLKELEGLEETEFIKGQKMGLNKLTQVQNVTGLKNFLADSISKLEKSIFDNSQTGKELMRGVLMGYYIIYNYLEGVDGYERDE